MTDPSLFQGLSEQATHQVREGEAALLHDHSDAHGTAQGSAATLKEEAIDQAALDAQLKDGANTDVSLDHA